MTCAGPNASAADFFFAALNATAEHIMLIPKQSTHSITTTAPTAMRHKVSFASPFTPSMGVSHTPQPLGGGHVHVGIDGWDGDTAALSGFVSFLTTFVGYAIVISAVFLKVPQIVAILRTRNAKRMGGLASMTNYLVSTFSYTVTASWGIAHDLPLSCYGEHIVLFAQIIAADVAIGAYQRRIKGNNGRVALTAAFLFSCLMVALSTRSRLIPRGTHEILFYFKSLTIIIQKVPLILMPMKEKKAGCLSLSACIFSFILYCVRIITTAVEVRWDQGKLPMIIGFVSSSLLMGILMMQFLLEKEEEKKKSVPSRIHNFFHRLKVKIKNKFRRHFGGNGRRASDSPDDEEDGERDEEND